MRIPTLSQLSEEHRVMLQEESGISRQVIRERGYRTIRDTRELREVGFSASQCHGPGLLIPISHVNEEIEGISTVLKYQFRPDTARTVDGKPVKYETPAGNKICLDVPRRSAELIADRNTALWITEGIKKADAAASNGLCCIALLGVDCFRVDDWEFVPLANRSVNICFDSDVMVKAAVRHALERLSAFLRERGANVKYTILPVSADGSKTGLDDFLRQTGDIHDLMNHVHDQLPLTDDDNPFATGYTRASDLSDPVLPAKHFLGLYEGGLTLLIGETGSGKSSFLYNVAIRAAKGRAYLGVDHAEGNRCHVLYIDPENAGNTRSTRLERIAAGRPRRLVFHDGQDVDLSKPAHIERLKNFITSRGFNLVIIDPIANLFNTRDENDNAEAARQMRALIGIARATSACIVAVHHSGKNQTDIYGRGASARLAAADVGILFKSSADDDYDDTYNGTSTERKDYCRFQIVKNRYEGRASLYVQMDGRDRFTLSDRSEWLRNGPQSGRNRANIDEDILHHLSDGQWHSGTEIKSAMVEEGHKASAVTRALTRLTQAQAIEHRTLPGHGGPREYRLATLAEIVAASVLS